MKVLYIKLFCALLMLAFFGCSIPNFAGSADSARVVAFRSEELGFDSYFLVVVPNKDKEAYPVLYLLQGSGSDPYGWTYYNTMQDIANEHEMIIVSAAAGHAPWTTPYTGKMIDYVLEIVDLVDQTYNTIPDKKHRAVGGLSLGGFGALRIIAAHPEVFGSGSSMSGGFDAASNAAYQLFMGSNIMFDCGTGDSLFPGNRALHDKLTELNVPHTFNTYTGGHNTYYFEEHAESHYKFHSEFFKRN